MSTAFVMPMMAADQPPSAVTIFGYLRTIRMNPAEPYDPVTNPALAVFVDPALASHVGTSPYAIVMEHPGNVFRPYYGGSDTMSKLITVSLYQAQALSGDTPDRTQLTDVFNHVSQAVHYVNEDVTAGQFVALHRVTEHAPYFDPKTRGLFGFVRFRMLYSRA